MRRTAFGICLAVFLISLGIASITAVLAANSSISSGSLKDRVNALAKIQPGLGTIMTEYGNRFVDVYYAAHGGNWGLAQFQLKEMTEIQEVGETTRPEHASSLKAFEDGYLKPLEKAVANKDWKTFQRRYQDTVSGCNGCHAATGHAFIHFRLPPRPVEDYLDFSLKSDPKR